ncbi:MAG: glycosyltransferase [Deltaproteobacteria bacterium]|nr:glycosyltransferase [Deltaproteobacteria bacterium]
MVHNGFTQVLKNYMARLLVISTFEVYPRGGLLSGPAIRTLEIARALSRLGHEIVLAQAHRLPDAEDVKDHFRVVRWDEHNFESLCKDADAVFAAHYLGEFLYEKAKGVPIVIDLFDPEFMALLESGVLFRDRDEHFDRLSNVRANLDAALTAGDLFVCANDRQKDFYLGMLSLAGRITPETLPEQVLAVVPTGAPSDPPKRKGDLVLFRGGGLPGNWNIIICPGGLYPWFDSETPILALRKLINQYPDTALIFVGAKNPISPKFSEAGVETAEKLASELDLLHKHVFFHPWVAYEDRGILYLESDLAVISSKASHETTYSFRTRIIDCLWGGLPIVCTSGDSLCSTIEEAGAGRTVPPLDPDALALAMAEYIGNESARTEASKSSLHLARNTYSWDKSVEPIHEFLLRVKGPKHPTHHETRSTDRVTVGLDLKRQQRLLEQKSHSEFKVTAAEKRLRKLRKRLDLASRTVRNLTLEVESVRQRAEKAEATISYIHSGRGWRLLQTYFRFRDRFFPIVNVLRTPIRYVRTWGFLTAFRRLVRRPSVTAAPLLLEQYKARIRNGNANHVNAGRMRKEADSWAWKPLISIATPTYNTDPAFLSQAINSVRGQLYSNWELCLVDDGSTQTEVREVIRSAVESDPRIRCRFLPDNQGIVEASNACLSMCKGEFVAFLDHDDTLEPHALWDLKRFTGFGMGSL